MRDQRENAQPKLAEITMMVQWFINLETWNHLALNHICEPQDEVFAYDSGGGGTKGSTRRLCVYTHVKANFGTSLHIIAW